MRDYYFCVRTLYTFMVTAEMPVIRSVAAHTMTGHKRK